MLRLLACCLVFAFASTASSAFAEKESRLSFCVVQIPSGKDNAQNTGMDARKLATELSQRKRDGQFVTAVSIVSDAKSTDAAIERTGCSYVVVLQRHESVDESSFQDDPGPMPMGDKDMILYTLRSRDSRKTILSGAVPPTTYRGHSERPAYVPYPVIADAVLKKVLQRNASEQGR